MPVFKDAYAEYIDQRIKEETDKLKMVILYLQERIEKLEAENE